MRTSWLPLLLLISCKWLEILKKCRRNPGESSPVMGRKEWEPQKHIPASSLLTHSKGSTRNMRLPGNEVYRSFLEPLLFYRTKCCPFQRWSLEMLHLTVIGSWLLNFQPQGIGAGKERKRNCVWGEECGYRGRKNYDVIPCTFTGEEGSKDIPLDGLKWDHRLTRKELGFKSLETGKGPWEELVKEDVMGVGCEEEKFAQQLLDREPLGHGENLYNWIPGILTRAVPFRH